MQQPANACWPGQLVGLLREKSIAIEDPIIIAKTGWTTDELDEAIIEENPSGNFDIVSLLIGVNNQYRGRPEEDYRQQFERLLQRAIGFAGKNPHRVIVLSIPDWGVMPFAEGRDRVAIGIAIDRFNDINKEETVKTGAHYVDITPASRKAVDDPLLIAPDGLHPSGKMYTIWTELAIPVALSVLSVQKP